MKLSCQLGIITYFYLATVAKAPVKFKIVTSVPATGPILSVAAPAAQLSMVAIPKAPLVEKQVISREDSAGESSDGMGTISDAYQRHVVLGGVDLHHRHGSPNVRGALPSPTTDKDSTWTASEEDQQTAPGQIDDWDNNWGDDTERFWSNMDTGQPAAPSSSTAVSGTAPNKREMQSSTEEETDVIKLNVGSFVNSNLGRDRDCKKARTK